MAAADRRSLNDFTNGTAEGNRHGFPPDHLGKKGMSLDDRDALLARQGGVCGICKKHHRRLHVDHCHATRKVRGLLCGTCNRGLGHYNDDPVLTRAATAWLEASLRDPIATGSSGDAAAAGHPAGRPTQGLPIDHSPRQPPSSAFARFDVTHNDINHLIGQQEGARMTRTENTNALGPEPVSEPDLDVIVDPPPLVPAQAAMAAPALAPDDLATQGFTPLDLDELFALDIAQRGMVLDPIIPEKGLALLYAVRGTGKTHVALGIAHAVATGGKFLNWRAPSARRVLLVDGEMPAADLRDRLRTIVAGTGVAAAPGMLKVLAGDLLEDGIGNLARPELQRKLERCLDGVELLILDNLASLIAGQHENDADSWTTMQQWLLRLRRRGISVLIVHHAGKNGDQRGISNREDLLDTSGSWAARQACAAVRSDARNPRRQGDLVREDDRGRRARAGRGLAGRRTVDPRHCRGDRHPSVDGASAEEEARARRRNRPRRDGTNPITTMTWRAL